jgi:hypothetical protein
VEEEIEGNIFREHWGFGDGGETNHTPVGFVGEN